MNFRQQYCVAWAEEAHDIEAGKTVTIPTMRVRMLREAAIIPSLLCAGSAMEAHDLPPQNCHR